MRYNSNISIFISSEVQITKNIRQNFLLKPFINSFSLHSYPHVSEQPTKCILHFQHTLLQLQVSSNYYHLGNSVSATLGRNFPPGFTIYLQCYLKICLLNCLNLFLSLRTSLNSLISIFSGVHAELIIK